jgi:hypothetical protein
MCSGSNTFGELGIGTASDTGQGNILLFDVTSPAVKWVIVTSNPGSDSFYRAGDTIYITATYDEEVVVVGSPKVLLQVGSSQRRFNYVDQPSTDSIRFSYVVSPGDNDADGILIPSNPFEFGSGSAITDLASNGMTLVYSDGETRTDHKVDTSAATVVWTAPSAPSRSRNMSFALVFNEPITGLQSSDIENNGTAQNCLFSVTGADLTRNVSTTCDSDGTVIPKLLSGSVLDEAGNDSPGLDVASTAVVIDTVLPTLTWETVIGTSASRTVSIRMEPSEIVTGIELADFSNTGTATGCEMTLKESGASWTLEAICKSDGSFIPAFAKNGMTDQAGNTGPSEISKATSIEIDTTPDPPKGEVGISVNEGAAYTNDSSVNLFIVWPKGATGMKISSDGGFATAITSTMDVAKSHKWTLDNSVVGLYTKIVYIRFVGTKIDASKTYSDDIVLDTTPPVIESSLAAVASGSIDLILKATDDITGVDKVQIKNGATTVTKSYESKISVTEKELGLTVSASSVHKTDSSMIEIRVSDKAGNWTAYKSLSVSRTGSNTVTTPTVTTPTILIPKVTTSRSASAKSIAAFAKLKVLSTSKVKLKVVASSAKYCRVSGTTLKGLKAGSCKVTVTVTPKKGRATSKTVTLKVTK